MALRESVWAMMYGHETTETFALRVARLAQVIDADQGKVLVLDHEVSGNRHKCGHIDEREYCGRLESIINAALSITGPLPQQGIIGPTVVTPDN